MKIIQRTFVSYQTAEKFNVEMDDPPQCHVKLNAKKMVFTNVGLSKDCNAQYQLNHFKYNMCMYYQEYFQVILGYKFLLF